MYEVSYKYMQYYLILIIHASPLDNNDLQDLQDGVPSTRDDQTCRTILPDAWYLIPKIYC